MNTPDIEIYIKHADADEILLWLEKHFVNIQLPLTNDALSSNITIEGDAVASNSANPEVATDSVTIPIIITPSAAGKAFTSIWFKSALTPWKNDEACADSFLSVYDKEVRCAASSWQEGEDESGEYWLKLTRQGKSLIRW